MDADEEWLSFEAIAITTQPISAYGGFRARAELLDSLAAQFNAGQVPMHIEHDLTKPIQARKMSASVRQRIDAHHELVLRGEVLAADWRRAQHLPGLSLTLIEPIGEANPQAEVNLAADAAWFADDDIQTAGALIATAASTQPGRAYQFALVPEPQIFAELTYVTLQALGLNVTASALWDGVKYLLMRRRVPVGADESKATTINVTFTDLDRWSASVETNDPNVAAMALASLTDLVVKVKAAADENLVPPNARWDPASGRWAAADQLPDTPADDSPHSQPDL